jgi:glyoxylase-like metal-dependent hydrolase (beta-lactamase superfamily II)
MHTVRIELLNVGWLTAPAGIWRRGDDLDRKLRVPVPAYLIETAHERILVDTGLHPSAVADPGGHYANAAAVSVFGFAQDHSIAEQIDLGTITKVVLTHLHFDHAGALALLPASVPIIVQRREWTAGHDAAAVARNFYLPADYMGVERQLRLIDGEHDLLGDGSIRLLPTPGHTPGHQAVCVGEMLVLGADVAHFASTLDDRRFPAFGDDFDAQNRSADRLRGLRDHGATVLPGHDPSVLVPGPLTF